MKNKQLTLLVVFTILFVTTIQSQPKNYNIRNGFSIGGGLTQFNIKTDNLMSAKGNGFVASLSATVDIPHRWYTVSYGMQISQNTLEILGRTNQGAVGNEIIEYKLMVAQLGFLFHGKIVGSHLTLDAGPQLQYNSELDLKNSQQESYYINGYDNLSATDISDISKFNINGAVGLTAGIGPLKIRAQYIYGFLNMLEKLNDANIDSGSASFKGNPETIMFTAMFTF